MKKLRNNFAVSSLLMVSPLAAVLLIFLVLPIVLIVIVSFWRATEFSIIPAFELDNYEFLFGSPVTYTVFFNTFKYALITWFCTVLLGFTILLSGFSHPYADLANRAVPTLHNSILDQQYNPNDIMDPVSRPKRDSQFHAHLLGRDRRTH